MPRIKQDALLSLPYVHKRKDGLTYVRICYAGAGGKWLCKSKRVDTVEEAVREIERIKRELGLRGPDAFVGERMTFDKLLAEFRIDHPDMPEWYAQPIADYFATRRIVGITHADLKRFKAMREQEPNKATGATRKPSTINRELECLRTVLLYAVRHGWLAVSPFGKGEPLISKAEEEPRSRIPSPDEEARILAQCAGSRAHLRPILIAAKDTGLRKSALLILAWSNADLAGGFLRIPQGKRNKRRPKVIAMTARLKAELLDLWEKSDKEPTGKIFGGVKDVKRSYTTACRLAGVEDLRFHDWRHGYVTDLAEAGVEERLAMIAAGHTSADTHAVYTNIDERIAQMIAGRLDSLHAARQPAGVGEAPERDEWIN